MIKFPFIELLCGNPSEEDKIIENNWYCESCISGIVNKPFLDIPIGSHIELFHEKDAIYRVKYINCNYREHERRRDLFMNQFSKCKYNVRKLMEWWINEEDSTVNKIIFEIVPKIENTDIILDFKILNDDV